MDNVRKYFAVSFAGEVKAVYWHQWYNADTLHDRIERSPTLSEKQVTESEATTLREFCDIPLMHYNEMNDWINRKRFRS